MSEAIFLGCSMILTGSFPRAGNQNKASLSASIMDLGGSITQKVTSTTTHLVCTENEYAKRGAKVTQVIKFNETGEHPRIYILDHAWLRESIANEAREPEDEWDLEMNADESDEEHDRLEREAKAAKKEALKVSKVEAKRNKRAESEASGSS